MCGIAGSIARDPRRPAPRAPVEAMLARLAERGPDGEGLVVSSGGVLGHRRLAVLDLSPAARQPFASEDGATFAATNGEIWNHRELRRELEARGHRFVSACDAEVVVHLYEEHGADSIARLDGMFALAVWDTRRRSLLLARDRFGEKPLYWHEGPDGIAFASELRALLAGGVVPRGDETALSQFLTFRFVPAPATGFAGIRKLPPAHWLRWEEGRFEVKRWWAPPEPADGPVASGPGDVALRQAFDAAAGELRRLLGEAVRRRLDSDVPLGLLLSGGLDSAAIAFEMARACGGGFDTFTAGFGEKEYDETALASEVARRVGSRHHVVRLEPDVASALPRLVERAGEPFADSSLVAVEALARAVRPHVTVALGGDGGDEVLGGYDRYVALLVAGAVGAPVRRFVASLVGGPVGDAARSVLGLSADRRNLTGRALRFAEAQADPLAANATWLTCFDEEAKRRLAGRPAAEPSGEAPGGDPAAALTSCYPTRGTPLERALYADLVRTLPDRMAFKLDTATMSVALEARSPFLDRDLVEWSCRLPGGWKVGIGRTKRLLRRAYAAEFPPALLRARKAGFGLPADRWLRGPLRGMLQDLLLSPGAARGLYEPRTVAPLIEEHLSGRRNHDDRLWALLCLELWHRRFLDGRGAERVGSEAVSLGAGAGPADPAPAEKDPRRG